jgi:hypothetical protein
MAQKYPRKGKVAVVTLLSTLAIEMLEPLQPRSHSNGRNILMLFLVVYYRSNNRNIIHVNVFLSASCMHILLAYLSKSICNLPAEGEPAGVHWLWPASFLSLPTRRHPLRHSGHAESWDCNNKNNKNMGDKSIGKNSIFFQVSSLTSHWLRSAE